MVHYMYVTVQKNSKLCTSIVGDEVMSHEVILSQAKFLCTHTTFLDINIHALKRGKHML